MILCIIDIALAHFPKLVYKAEIIHSERQLAINSRSILSLWVPHHDWSQGKFSISHFDTNFKIPPIFFQNFCFIYTLYSVKSIPDHIR